jgi:hypothetical protein
VKVTAPTNVDAAVICKPPVEVIPPAAMISLLNLNLLRLIGYPFYRLCEPGIARLIGTVQILFALVPLKLKAVLIRLTDQTDNACPAERPALPWGEPLQLCHRNATATLQRAGANINVPAHFELFDSHIIPF